MKPPRGTTRALLSDLSARLDEHNAGRCSHTAKHRPWSVDVAIQFADRELGYAFVRTADNVHVSRFIDTRGMTPENRQQFELAIRTAESSGEPDSPDVTPCLARLKTMLAYSDEGRPPLEFSDWRELTPPPAERIGPGSSDCV